MNKKIDRNFVAKNSSLLKSKHCNNFKMTINSYDNDHNRRNVQLSRMWMIKIYLQKFSRMQKFVNRAFMH